MFTGIVEETGLVQSIEEHAEGIRLSVGALQCAENTRLGDSIAVNGCCLTVAGIAPAEGRTSLQFDLLHETWIRTNLSRQKPGTRVNLERALAAGGRMGGHFVTGHIDATGVIQRWEKQGKDYILEIATPPEVLQHAVSKGCIAIDGISLTISDLLPGGVRLWIIPHTFAVTALSERSVGDWVNLEADLLSKYVGRLLAQRHEAGTTA